MSTITLDSIKEDNLQIAAMYESKLDKLTGANEEEVQKNYEECVRRIDQANSLVRWCKERVNEHR